MTTIVSGRCCSAALFPQLAGDSRLAFREALFFFHFGELVSPIKGRLSATNLRSGAELVEAMDEEFINTTSVRCRWWPPHEILTAYTDKITFDAHAARLKGIVHQVLY